MGQTKTVALSLRLVEFIRRIVYSSPHTTITFGQLFRGRCFVRGLVNRSALRFERADFVAQPILRAGVLREQFSGFAQISRDDEPKATDDFFALAKWAIHHDSRPGNI